jgi:hypothetical protein
MFKIIMFISIACSSIVYAQADSTKSWRAFGTYSPWDMWLPGKIGAVASYGDNSRTFELAWQKASYGLNLIVDDIGSISDQRIHLTTRSFTWDNSFNFQYGLSYNSFVVNLGKSFVAADVLEMKTVATVWGVGNRWELENGFTFGADWLKIFVPIYTLEKKDSALDGAISKSDKDDLDELINIISKVPTLTLIHLEVGYRF